MKIEVKGLDRLIKGFETAGNAQKVNAVVDKALEKVAVKIEAQAKTNLTESVYSTPESGYVRTGNLRGEALTTVKIPKGWAVVDSMEYAAYVEFGTGLRGDPSVPHTKRAKWTYRHPRYTNMKGKSVTRDVTGMAPRPFLLPAFNKYKDKIPNLIQINLSKALREAIKGHG